MVKKKKRRERRRKREINGGFRVWRENSMPLEMVYWMEMVGFVELTMMIDEWCGTVGV